MDEQKLVPKLRFPGFTDPWEQRKLEEMGSTYSGMSGKTKEDFGHGEAVYIPYLNIFQNTLSNLSMTDKVEIDDTQNKVEYGDILFTTSSETPEEVGLSSVWLGNQENLYLNSFCFGYRLKEIIDLYFLGYALRSPYMRNQMKILAQGISRYNISKNKVMDLQINIPCIKEQKYIGEIFLRIDSLITLHQRKLEHLKLKKKSLLQKLFPKEGELYPELRFPGFTDPWEQCKLGEIVNIERGGSPRPIDNYITADADGLNWIKIGDAPEQGRYIVHAAEKIKPSGLSKTRQVEPGDLILSNSMSFGKPYIMGIPGCIHDGWLLIRNNQNIFDLKFLCNLLGTDQIHAQYRRLAAGSAVNNLNKELVSGTNVGVPSKAEQLKIGQFFESMDEYITLHQRKLEHLQLLKKALLQQLFV